jgi:hypothetical protein
MMTRFSIDARRVFGVAAGLLVTMGLLGADDAKKTIEAGGVTFQAAATWKSVPTRSQMRKAQLQVEPVKGDDFSAELVVFAFPGGAGSVEDNVARWQRQFKDANGDAPKVESKKVKAKNAEATRVEIAGHYYPTAFPGTPAGPDRPNARLLGAIVVTDKNGYFLKMVGPDKTMKEASKAFDDLIASLEVHED